MGNRIGSKGFKLLPGHSLSPLVRGEKGCLFGNDVISWYVNEKGDPHHDLICEGAEAILSFTHSGFAGVALVSEVRSHLDPIVKRAVKHGFKVGGDWGINAHTPLDIQDNVSGTHLFRGTYGEYLKEIDVGHNPRHAAPHYYTAGGHRKDDVWIRDLLVKRQRAISRTLASVGMDSDWMPTKAEQMLIQFDEGEHIPGSKTYDKRLGCGVFGCVYKTRIPGVVCKVTSDSSEADFVLASKSLPVSPKNLPGVVEYLPEGNPRVLLFPPTVQHSPQPGMNERPVFIMWRREASIVGDGLSRALLRQWKEEGGRADSPQKFLNMVSAFRAHAANLYKMLFHARQDLEDDGSYEEYIVKLKELAAQFKGNIDDDVTKWYTSPDRVPRVPGWHITVFGPVFVPAEVTQQYHNIGWYAYHLASLEYIAQQIASTKEGRWVGQALEYYCDQDLPICDAHTGNIGLVGDKIEIIDTGWALPLRREWFNIWRTATLISEEPLPQAQAASNPPPVFSPRGIGGTPWQEEVERLGFTLKMSPYTFLALALPLKYELQRSLTHIGRAMDKGEEIAPPFLEIEWRDDAWHVISHEGRHRARSMIEAGYRDPIPVHIFPRGMRPQDITPEMKIALMTEGMYAEVATDRETPRWVDANWTIPSEEPETEQEFQAERSRLERR